MFVPLIWWSAAVWLCATGPLFSLALPEWLPFAQYIVPNAALIGYIAYAGYYLTLDIVAALVADTVLFLLLVAANVFFQMFGAVAWKYALVVHVLGWYMQIHPGHMVFEKRKPALLDSFFQSLCLAPLFVFFEVVFFLGLRKDLYNKVQVAIKARQAQMAKKTK